MTPNPSSAPLERGQDAMDMDDQPLGSAATKKAEIADDKAIVDRIVDAGIRAQLEQVEASRLKFNLSQRRASLPPPGYCRSRVGEQCFSVRPG